MASFLPVFPGSLQEAGANLHDNAIDVGNSLAMRGRQAVAAPLDLLRGVGNFMDGITSGRTGNPSSVTVKLPPVVPLKGAGPGIAAAGPVAVKPVAVDPTAGLAGLSFRQMLALAQTGQAEQRATAKPIGAVDQAGNQLAAIYQGQFSKSLSAAGNDPGKQQAAIDAFEKKMLPIALKGNTADAAIFDGPTPGAQ